MTESALVEIELAQLFPDPSQPRKVFDEEAIKALREDIKNNGLKEALDINPLLDGRTTKYLIIDGECRFHAIEGIEDFGMVPCNLYAYKSQRDIDKHRASKHFHRKDWNPADRAEWLKYYMTTHKLRQQDLAREFSVKQATVSRWLSPMKDGKLLKALRSAEITFTQAFMLSKIDDAETRENALSEAVGKSKEETEEIIHSVYSTPETPKTPEEDALTVHEEEGEEIKEEEVSTRTSLSSETGDIIEDGFAKGGETLEREAEPQESAKPENSMSEDEPPPETTEKPVKEPKPIKFVDRMLRLSQATDSHMREKELEELPDSRYRKLLKDYEEASFTIDGFRDFLQGRENNGSVQFNRAKRLHTALGRFDAHTISSLKEATDLRTIKINTKKKLTHDVNILDTTIKNKAKKPPSQEGE